MLTEALQQTLEAFMEYLRLERNASPLTLTTYRPAITSYMECALELARDVHNPCCSTTSSTTPMQPLTSKELTAVPLHNDRYGHACS